MARLRWRRESHSGLGTVIGWLVDSSIVESPASDFYRNQLLRGAKSRGDQLGYQIEPFAINSAKLRPERLKQILTTRGIEAVIITPLPDQHHEVQLDLKGFANASIGFSVSRPALHRVAHNEFANTYATLEKAIKRGYRKPAFLYSMSLDQPVLSQAMGAYYACLMHYLPDYKWAPFIREDLTSSTTAEWLKKVQPDVVLSNANLLPWMLDQQIIDPRKTGFACTSLEPKEGQVSGMVLDWAVLGSAAIDVAVAQLHRNESGYPAERKTMLIDGKWNPGETLGEQ
jgi:hypothetical protein